jgi:hypothetical protein
MNALWTFLNSPLFVALLGATGAITAYVIYIRKIRSNKKDAANILLLEIQNAKRQFSIAKKQIKDAGDDETKMLAEDTFLMPNHSWNKYKYIFVRNFDRDEWDALSLFYDKCLLFDEAIIHNNRAFPQNAEQLRAAMNQATTSILMKYAIDNPDEEAGSEKEQIAIINAQKAHDLIQSQAASLYSYAPRKPVIDAQTQLNELSDINLSSIVTKLKKIADIRN